MKFKNILLFSAIGYGGYKVLGKYSLDPETAMCIEDRLAKYGLK